jgi:hypothetical protein
MNQIKHLFFLIAFGSLTTYAELSPVAERFDYRVNSPRLAANATSSDIQGQARTSKPDRANSNKVYVSQIWDDAILNDLRLIKILKKYKAKATFAVDAGDLTEKRQTNAWLWGHAFFRTEAEWSDIEAKISRLSRDLSVVWVNTSDLFDPLKGCCPSLENPVSPSKNNVVPEVKAQTKIVK